MSTQTFFIEGKLPGYNEYLGAAKGPFGASEYTKLKKSTQAIVWFYARKAKMQPCVGPVHVHLVWHEPDKRRDKDNVISGCKEILDSLRVMGVLKNDSWRWVTDITASVEHSPDRPGVLVQLLEDRE